MDLRKCMHTCIYSQLISDKIKSNTVENSLFQKMVPEHLTSTCKNNNNNKPDPDIDFTPFTKINAKSITDLNVKCKTVKPLEDNTQEETYDLGYGSYFLDIIPKA